MTLSRAATMGATLAAVAPYVTHYGYLAVAAGVGLESAGLPLPGETTLLAAAALASHGELNVWLVAATGALASTLGDNLGFAIGRAGGRRLLDRFDGRFLPKGSLARVDHFFARWGPASVIVARFITGVRVIAAMAAGASDMPWRTFLPYNAAGAVLWAGTVTAVGYLAGDATQVIHPGVITFHRAVGVALGLSLIALAVHALRARIREERGGAGE